MSTFLFVIAALVVLGLLLRWRGSMLLRALFHPLTERGRLSFFDAYPIASEDVVLFGDSISAGGQWEEIAPQVQIKNRGIGGDLSDDVLKRLEPIAEGLPDKVFVQIGTNDLGIGVAPERILANLESIVDRFQEAAPETRIYLHELFPTKARRADGIRALNAEISQLAETRSLPIVRVFDHFSDDHGAIRDEYTYDNLHLTGVGYQEWYTLLEPYLLEER